MGEARTGSTGWTARVRRGAAGLAAALALVAVARPAAALASDAGGSRLAYDVASTLVARTQTLVSATSASVAEAGTDVASNATGVVLAAASEVTPLEAGIRTHYIVHRYLQTTDPARYVEQVEEGAWPARFAGVSGAPISVQLADDPEAAPTAALGEAIEGFEPFAAEGNTYVTAGALSQAADGTVARPAASALNAAPTVAAEGETHVHLFYTRAAYQLRVVPGEGVASVAASGSGATSSETLTVAVRYGRPVAVSATLEGGFEDLQWEVQSGAATVVPGEGGTASIEAMPAGQVTLVASASRATYRVRLMGEGALDWPQSELDGLALADERLDGVYTYRTGTDLVLPALAARRGRTLAGWAVSGHVEGANPRVERRSELTEYGEQPYWVFVGEQSYGDVELTAMWDSQWHSLALEPVPAGVELSSANGLPTGTRRNIAVLSGVGVFRTDESTLEADRIDTDEANWLSGNELPSRVYTVTYDPAGGRVADHAAGEVVTDTHAIGFVGYEGSVVSDGAARRAILIAAEKVGDGLRGRVTEDLDVSAMAGAGTVLTGVWNEAQDAFALPEVTRPGYVFAGWYEGGVRRDLGVAQLVPSTVRTELVAHWSPVTYRVTYGNLGAELVGEAVLDGGARLALPAASTVPGGGEGGHTVYTVQSGSWVLPEPSAAESPAGYEFAGYILDVEDGALDGRLSSPTGVVLAPVTHDGDGRHGGATIGATSHANLRATATWRPARFAVKLAAGDVTAAAKVGAVYGEHGTGELYLERPASATSDLEGALAKDPVSGKVLDLPSRSYRVSYAAGAGEDAVGGVPETAVVTSEFTGYWYVGADGVARRVIRPVAREDGTLVGVLEDEPYEDVAEGQPATARELVASWTADVTLEARWSGDASVALPVPEREGWAFDGWLLGGEGVAARVLAGGEDASYAPAGTASQLTLTAQWSRGEFGIEYELPADAVLGAALPSRYSGDEAFELPRPSRSGYRFAGWYGGPADARDEYDASEASESMTIDIAAGDLWFGSAWEPVGYRVWLALPASETGLVERTAAGWNAVPYAERAELAAPAGRGVLDVAAGEEALSEVLEAASAGGASRLGTLAEASKFVTAWVRGYAAGEKLALPVPYKAGYTFAGWALRLASLDAAGKPTDGAGEGRATVVGTAADEQALSPESWGNVVATPTWRRNTYRVSFAPGAPLGKDEAVFAGAGGFDAHGALAMEASAFVASYDMGYELPESLYERQHSVRFDAHVSASEEASVKAPATVAGSWEFAGWQLPDGSVHRPGEQVRNLATDGTATVTATWSATGKVTLPAGPLRLGWNFVGWSESADATADGSQGAVLSAGSEYVPQRNVTLYAVWERGYRVSYDLGVTSAAALSGWVMPSTGETLEADAARFVTEGGWPNPGTLSAAELGAGGAVALWSPQMDGYRFLGWYEDGVDLGGVDAAAVISEPADHVVRAKWEVLAGNLVVKINDYPLDSTTLQYCQTVDGEAIPELYIGSLNAELGNATYDAATGTLVSDPMPLLVGDYEFSIDDSATIDNYVGAESGISFEPVTIKDGETTTIEFDRVDVTRLRTSAISVMAEETAEEKKRAEEWIFMSYALKSTSPNNEGAQEYGFPRDSALNHVYIMRFPASVTEDSLKDGSHLGGTASTSVRDRTSNP